jgi:hypothetical protein
MATICGMSVILTIAAVPGQTAAEHDGQHHQADVVQPGHEEGDHGGGDHRHAGPEHAATRGAGELIALRPKMKVSATMK